MSTLLQVSSMSDVQIILFAADLTLCCSSNLRELHSPWPTQLSIPLARDQPACFAWNSRVSWNIELLVLKMGHPQGNGMTAILHVTEIILIVPLFSCSTTTFYKWATNGQHTWSSVPQDSDSPVDVCSFMFCSLLSELIHSKEGFVFISFSLVGIQIWSLDWLCLKSLIPGFDDMLTNQRAWHKPVELAPSVGRSCSWIRGQRKPTRPQSCQQSCQRRWPCHHCLSVASPFTEGLPCLLAPQ